MTESRHPSDEQLSAAIDGLDAAAAAHAADCSRCSYRLEAMRGVASAIGTPPPANDAVRERVLAAALEEDAAEDVEGSSPSWARSTPPLAWIAGIAAALLLAVLVVPALLGGDDRADRSADGDVATDMMAGDDAGVAEAPDLGSFNDPQELAAAIGPLIGEDAGDGAEGAASPTTTAVAPAAGNRAAGGAAGPEFSSGTPCESTVRDEYGEGLGRQVYAAFLTWQGTPAVLLAYDVEGAEGPLDHRVFVLSREDCTLLTWLSI